MRRLQSGPHKPPGGKGEHQIRIVVAITTLLLGPLDLGNHLIAKEGMLEMMLVMAGTEDTLQQKVGTRGKQTGGGSYEGGEGRGSWGSG